MCCRIFYVLGSGKMNDKREIIKAEIDKYIKDDKLDFLYCYNPYLYDQIRKLSIDNIFVSEDALKWENKYCYKHNQICHEHDYLYDINDNRYSTPTYPIYSVFIDKKGNPYKTLVGWYRENGEVKLNLDDIYYEPVYEKTHLFPKDSKREKIIHFLSVVLLPIPFIITVLASLAYHT